MHFHRYEHSDITYIYQLFTFFLLKIRYLAILRSALNIVLIKNTHHNILWWGIHYAVCVRMYPVIVL